MMSDDEKQTFIRFIAADDGCVLVFSKNYRKDILLFTRVCACASVQQQDGAYYKKHAEKRRSRCLAILRSARSAPTL